MGSRQVLTTLFLDIGGVLLTNGWDRRSRKGAAEKFDLDYEDMNERHHLTYDTYESGKITLDEYLDRVVFHRFRNFRRDEFTDFIYAQSEAYPDMINLVKTLKSRHNLRVGVISNEGRELTEYRITKFELKEFVDFFVCSCFVRIRKPDKDIFQMALDLAQTRASESVFVDDRKLFVSIAERLGMKGVHHQEYESTRRILSEVGLTL